MMEILKCAECGKMFMASRPDTLYCSSQCRGRAIRRRKTIRQVKKAVTANNPKSDICVICGKPIDRKLRGSQAKTCTKECGKLLAIKTDKEDKAKQNAKRANMSLEEYRLRQRSYEMNKEVLDYDREFQEKAKVKNQQLKERRHAAAKYKKQGIKEDLEAKELGISHGEYQALKYSGKLEEFKKRKAAETQCVNVYTSQIIGD